MRAWLIAALGAMLLTAPVAGAEEPRQQAQAQAGGQATDRLADRWDRTLAEIDRQWHRLRQSAGPGLEAAQARLQQAFQDLQRLWNEQTAELRETSATEKAQERESQ